MTRSVYGGGHYGPAAVSTFRMCFEENKRHWMDAGDPTLIKMESVSHRDQKATRVHLLIRSRCGL